MLLQVSKFSREDNLVYSKWFEDYDLNHQLGPAWNDAELDQIFKEDDDLLSFFHDDQLIAVAGVAIPDSEHSYYCMTSLAVLPEKRGIGIGQQALEMVIDLYPLRVGQYWIAYVDHDNHRALNFFRRAGWQIVSEPPLNNNMYLVSFHNRDQHRPRGKYDSVRIGEAPTNETGVVKLML